MSSYITLPDDENLLDFLNQSFNFVLGPYSKDNGRQFVIIHDAIFTKTLTYPRYLWMMHHQQLIPDGYEVDHIDNDFTNNTISNLQLLTTTDNNLKRDKVLGYNSSGYTFNCPVCGTQRTIPQWIYNQNQVKKGCPGPYCSKSCSITARKKVI